MKLNWFLAGCFLYSPLLIAQDIVSPRVGTDIIITNSTTESRHPADSETEFWNSFHSQAPSIASNQENAADDVPGTPLNLNSAAALILDQKNGHTLYAKNTNTRVPIASITKLMTAMVLLDADLPANEKIKITKSDVDTLRGSSSRLAVGTALTRQELLQLALMASENRAASALARTYPGGTDKFVAAMNSKARQLGMLQTRFVDSTGLNSANISTAADLAKMVKAGYRYDTIREMSTAPSSVFKTRARGRPLMFKNTNLLVRKKNSGWQIGLSKTGFINEAGRCLVMQAQIAQRSVIIVLLDAWASQARVADANRIKKWIENSKPIKTASAGRSS